LRAAAARSAIVVGDDFERHSLMPPSHHDAGCCQTQRHYFESQHLAVSEPLPSNPCPPLPTNLVLSRLFEHVDGVVCGGGFLAWTLYQQLRLHKPACTIALTFF
jgi:hypothetical protein